MKDIKFNIYIFLSFLGSRLSNINILYYEYVSQKKTYLFSPMKLPILFHLLISFSFKTFYCI